MKVLYVRIYNGLVCSEHVYKQSQLFEAFHLKSEIGKGLLDNQRCLDLANDIAINIVTRDQL